MKEFIRKIPIIGGLAQRLYHNFLNHPEINPRHKDDWTLRVEKINTIYGKFFSWKKDTIGEHLKKYSAHTRNELAMIKSFIVSGDNIIDIGAHIGTFSIPFSLFNKAEGTVFAFEANPENYNLLRINIVENNAGSSIFPFLAVVSSRKSSYRMFLPEQGNSGTYSFLPDRKGVIKGNSCLNIDLWHDQNHKNLSIHFIKIDVEGAEMSVLESCQNLIKKYKPILYIEINEIALDRFKDSIEDIERFLRYHEYHFYRNIGDRNSDNDIFQLCRMTTLKEGGAFFDLLAIHPTSQNYPKQLG